jgi:hypothetical protein
MNDNGFRCFNANPNLVTLYTQDRDSDVIANAQ